MKLYKYYSPESLSIKSVLENQEIYFSSPLSFNDPFECKPFYRMPTRKEVETELLAYGFMKSSVNRKTREIMKVCEGLVKTGFQQYVEKFSTQTGILCLAENYMNELMWAHYARDHTGLCFEFNLDEFSVEGFSGFEDSDFGAYEAVTYSKDYPASLCIKKLTLAKSKYALIESKVNVN